MDNSAMEWPSPLCGSVCLGACFAMLRIEAPEAEPASSQVQNLLDSDKNAGPEKDRDQRIFLVAGA